jgi:hypothetical protein
MNKVMNAQISATRCWSGAGAKRLRSPQKSKTTGGASPVVLEVYHKVEAGLLVKVSCRPPIWPAASVEFIHDMII